MIWVIYIPSMLKNQSTSKAKKYVRFSVDDTIEQRQKINHDTAEKNTERIYDDMLRELPEKILIAQMNNEDYAEYTQFLPRNLYNEKRLKHRLKEYFGENIIRISAIEVRKPALQYGFRIYFTKYFIQTYDRDSSDDDSDNDSLATDFMNTDE
jgi:hypothetical protein